MSTLQDRATIENDTSTPKPVGRPTMLTIETIDKLDQAIGLGSPFTLACMYAGISYDTFVNWRKRHREGDDNPLLEELVTRLRLAEGRSVVTSLARIEKAAQSGEWKADTWKLERRYPNAFGRSVQEHTGKDGKPIEVITASIEIHKPKELEDSVEAEVTEIEEKEDG